jgi:hypothetical protein
MKKHVSFGLAVATLGGIALARLHAAADSSSLGYYRQEEIKRNPIATPVAPKYPDKSFKPRSTRGTQSGSADQRDQQP